MNSNDTYGIPLALRLISLIRANKKNEFTTRSLFDCFDLSNMSKGQQGALRRRILIRIKNFENSGLISCDTRIVTNDKGAKYIQHYYSITENFKKL